MTNQNKTLISYFPNYLADNALFTKMSVLGAPWDNAIGQDMDAIYFTMYSGIKTPSSFVAINSTDDVANSLTIARLLWSFYGINWQRLWDAYQAEYSPLDNYNLTEKVTRDQTDDRTEKRTTNNTGNQTDDITNNTTTTSTDDSTTTLQHGQTITRDDTVSEYVYGFNSNEEVPTTVNVSNGTEVHSGTDTTIVDDDAHSTVNSTGKNTSNYTEDGTVDGTTNDVLNEQITREKSGLTGVSYQDLLSQEFELWKWNFYKQVFDDVDKFLALSVTTC